MQQDDSRFHCQVRLKKEAEIIPGCVVYTTLCLLRDRSTRSYE
jgi:hypothetical protein